MFRHRVQGGVKRLGDIQKPRRPVCQLRDDRPTSRVRNGGQNVSQLIHTQHYTKRCNILQADFHDFFSCFVLDEPQNLRSE